MIKQIIFASFTAALIAGTASAQDGDKEFQEAVNKRLQALEANFKKSAEEGEKKPSWYDLFKISGDFRLRYEEIKLESSEKQRRGRIRARLNIVGQVNDEIDAVIRLASGSSDPISTNQSFDDSGSSKDIVLDLAYVKYDPSCLEGFSITGGKIPNPLFQPGDSNLVWDPDLNPEGAGINWSADIEDIEVFYNGLGWWIEENPTAADSTLISNQVGLTADLGGASATVGAGYHYYNATENNPTFFSTTNAFGNSATSSITAPIVLFYNENFRILELFGELGFNMDECPIMFFGHFVKNQGADVSDEDRGYLLGVQVGKAKKPWEWEAQYDFRNVESDAVIGAFTDSDSGGGGTDWKGSRIKGKVKVQKNWDVIVAYYLSERSQSSANQLDYNRLQVDLQFKF